MIQCDTTVHDSVWTLTWYKDCGNGLFNPYDNLTAFIDAKDGSFMTMGRNTMEPNTTNPIVTEQQAIEFAQPVVGRFSGVGQTTAKLTYFRPNFYWENNRDLYKDADFIRLAWEIKLDDVAYIYVDALSGEILGGSDTKVYGRALCADPAFYRSDQLVTMANSALSRWGYNVSGGFGPWNGFIREEDVRWTLEYPNLTGMYLTCHGNVLFNGVGVIVGPLSSERDRNWVITADTVNETFHFVFLDACMSSHVSGIDSWRRAFHIGNNGSLTAFVGWNVSVEPVVSYDFCTRFWNYANTNTIYNSVILSLKEGREIYGVNCDPGFSGDVYYYGGAW